MHSQYVSTVQDVEKIKIVIDKISATNDEFRYVFHAPRKNPWFGGRVSELEDLAHLLRLDDASQSEVNIAAVCGLGGVGKTSLATEFAQQRKGFYTGGVYWFSGEDDTTFENSVNDVAIRLGTRNDSFGLTFSATLAMISRNKNPWLIVLDNMDQLNLSVNIFKLVSGTWQHDVSGHLLITTRRKPTALANDIRGFDEKCCLSLRCFEIEEGKKFLCCRIGVVKNEEIDIVAEKLVQQLGGLPLALEQAGAYIKSLSCTISQYLDLYDSQRLRLLNRQKATRVSEYDSPERLAVRTTWHLNFEHIKQTVDDGKAAIRFLYASAFLNPNEIQKDIINVGKPPVEDEEFCECVKTTLGCQQVLKLLTDFSLFKETLLSNLSVHHLVQEVIQETLNQEQQIQSIIDAIRMLHYAFQNCSSPDELLASATSKREERPSMVSSSNLLRFYKWHKLCLHSYELVKHLQRVVKQPDGHSAKVFQPETARIVYECAIHLSANTKHDEAKEVANFANDIFNLSKQQVPASSVLPHTIPLPELVRRHIQYSCNTPATSKKEECENGVKMPTDSVTPEQLEEMRMKGNNLFKKGSYLDALKMYSDAIDLSKNTAVFDVRLLSNRASVYLKLGQYDEALQDAEDYIMQRPKCWRGYARKALALVELKDVQGAYVAASLAYFYEKDVFRNFEPFMRKFNSLREKPPFVCRNSSDLSVAFIEAMCSGILKQVTNRLKVIILEPGNYLFPMALPLPMPVPIGNCILVGSEAECCSVTFHDKQNVNFNQVFIAYNVSFHSGFSNCHFLPDSVVKLTHCSFESSNDTFTSFCCKGKLKIDSCKFHNCTKGGLLVVGDAEIENSEFCGNGAGGLEVREGGRLLVRKSKMYANMQGLLIGPQVKECVVKDCELYDNEWGGIVVHTCASGVTIRRNRIYDNDEPGVSVIQNSNAYISENDILRNSDWGISVHGFSQAVVKKNKIHNNQCGGICVDSIFSTGKSVIEYNDISNNSGPGIYEEGSSIECRENKLPDNKEDRNQSTVQSEAKLCYFCKKPENNLKKCTRCFTAQYCETSCQKSDWKNHKQICGRLLSDGSILLKYVRKEMIMDHLSSNELNPLDDFSFAVATRSLGLLPIGPKYCSPPNTTTRFIVKMEAGFAVKKGDDFDHSVVRIYDRSQRIDGILIGADKVYHLVRQHGAMGQLTNRTKKLFMWVKGPEHGKLRVFTNEFPSYQYW